MFAAPVVLLMVLAAASSPPVDTARPLRVAVLDVQATKEVPARILAAFTQMLPLEIRKLEGVSAITSEEVRDMLAVERQRQLLGCDDDATCVAEIAGAIDAAEVVSTSLSLSAGTYSLAIRRVDVSKATVVQSQVRRVEQKDGEELLALVGPLVESLFPERALKPGRTRGVPTEVARRLNPPPLPRWAFFATAGAGVASIAAGGLFGVLANEAANDHQALAARSVDEPVHSADLLAVEQQAKSRAQTANVLFGVGGALLLGAGIQALFTDWQGDAQLVNVSVLPAPSGGSVFAEVRF